MAIKSFTNLVKIESLFKTARLNQKLQILCMCMYKCMYTQPSTPRKRNAIE